MSVVSEGCRRSVAHMARRWDRFPHDEDDWEDALPPPRPYPHLHHEPLYERAALATALNRKPRTIRDWERRHWLPKSPILQHGVTDLTDPANPVEDVRGRRYLYTHQMIQDARHIAFEEDILETTGVNLDDTRFPERVRRAWAIPESEPDPDAIINLAAMTTAELAAYNQAENLAQHQRTTQIVEFPPPDYSPRYDPFNPFCQRR